MVDDSAGEDAVTDRYGQTEVTALARSAHRIAAEKLDSGRATT